MLSHLMWGVPGAWMGGRPGGGCERCRASLCGGLNVGGPNRGGWGLDPFNVCPAVTYSPTPSRVQYHRRCGS